MARLRCSLACSLEKLLVMNSPVFNGRRRERGPGHSLDLIPALRLGGRLHCYNAA